MPEGSEAPAVPDTPSERRGGTLGRFTVTLAQESSDYATFDGKIYEAPVPTRVGWETTLEDGDCRLEEPRLGECPETCELPEFCAADANACQGEPPTVSVGEVTVWGLSTVGATPSFVLEPLNPTTNAYNATGSAALVYPPFEPGGPVVLEASGGELEPFAVGAFGIEPLHLDGEEPLSFTGEEDVPFRWEAGTVERAFIEAIVDISFHGGTKGRIVCTTDDDGEFVVIQALVQGLIDLGVAGFPHAELTRRTTSFANVANDHIEFNVVSRKTRLLSVPGVTSCVDDSECEADETCRDDSTCG
jgi:hypothetical protein